MDLLKKSDRQDGLAEEDKQLELLDDNSKSSITVQVVLRHPDHPLKVYWVLNRKEAMPNAGIRSLSPKPKGWGNPGGGVETVDMSDSLGNAHSFDDMLRACGQRETTDETGWIDFQFDGYTPSQSYFLRHVCPSGHRIFSLAAHLRTFGQIPVAEWEEKEIERGDWFDLTQSPVDLFENEMDLPYWSHVRRTIIVLNRIAQKNGCFLPSIHSLWKLVFPVGAKDLRFPSNGYYLPPYEWYKEMAYLIEHHAFKIDVDHIYELNRRDIDAQREAQRLSPREKKNTQSFIPPVREKSSALIPYGTGDAKRLATQEDLRLLAEYQARIAQEEKDWLAFIGTP